MKIAIGTNNRAKVAAVTNVISKHYNDPVFESFDVSSGVSAQPMSDEETRQGAIHRAENTAKISMANLSFGLEGGVREIAGSLYICNWGALKTEDGQLFTAAGLQFPLPKEIADQLLLGEELGPIMDRYTNKKNIRQNEGAVGVFTNGLVNRSQMFEQVVTVLVGQYFLSMKDKTISNQ